MTIDERIALSDRLATAADWLADEYLDGVVVPLELTTPHSISHDELLAYCVKVMREASEAVVPKGAA